VAKNLAQRRGQPTNARGELPSVFEGNAGSIFRIEGTVRRIKADAPVVDDGCSTPQGGAVGGGAGNMLLAVYAPGRNADVWPAGTAKLIPAGSHLIFQMHYSKATGRPEQDRTSVGLVFAKGPVSKVIESKDVTNFFFQIPAGAENHEATACYTFPRDVELVGYMPHLHVRGKDMKYELVYPDGRRSTLLSVPRYDFNWQTLYKLKQPVPVPKGARLVVTAHFDNSARNKSNPDPMRTVRFGEPTYDEMLVGFIDYARARPPLVKIDPRVYDAYTGEYTVGLGPTFTVTREGDHLFFTAPGQPKLEAFPESETKFFFKAVEAQVTFIKNEKGEVTELLFEVNRQSIRAKRVSK
jgi:hypothetical protein